MVVHRKDPENKKSGLFQLTEMRVGNASCRWAGKTRIGETVVGARHSRWHEHIDENPINAIVVAYINAIYT
jgi:hypothetical protein